MLTRLMAGPQRGGQRPGKSDPISAEAEAAQARSLACRSPSRGWLGAQPGLKPSGPDGSRAVHSSHRYGYGTCGQPLDVRRGCGASPRGVPPRWPTVLYGARRPAGLRFVVLLTAVRSAVTAVLLGRYIPETQGGSPRPAVRGSTSLGVDP